jgi:hypothetical protein
MISLNNRSRQPLLYRGQRFALLANLLEDGTAVDNDPGDIDIYLLDLAQNETFLGPLRMADSGRSDYALGLVDCIIPGSETAQMTYQGDAILAVQIVGGTRYTQTVRVM